MMAYGLTLRMVYLWDDWWGSYLVLMLAYELVSWMV